MIEYAVVPTSLALVNVDVQNCFVADSPLASPEALEVIERINRLAATCRAANILVVHVRHVLQPDGSNAGVLAEISPLVKHGIIAQGSRSASLHAALVVDERDLLLEKPRFGAFHGTDLERLLHSRGINSVMITGISTTVCCETTAREAAVRDFRVFFLSDGTASSGFGDLSATELKRAACATLGRMFAQVLTVDEMIEKLARAAAAVPHRGCGA
jgi:nicotinamidase-related amidase